MKRFDEDLFSRPTQLLTMPTLFPIELELPFTAGRLAKIMRLRGRVALALDIGTFLA